MFCECHVYSSWIILRMRIITSGGLSAVFHGLLPPSLPELQLSVLQWSSVAPRGGMLLFLGVAKRWLPGCSATVQILRLCTCFQDNWHLKGRLRLLTVCPSPALCLHLKTVWFNLWLFLSFSTDALYELSVPSWQPMEVLSRRTNVSGKLRVNFGSWVEKLNRRGSILPCFVHFNSTKGFHWGGIWVVLHA